MNSMKKLGITALVCVILFAGCVGDFKNKTGDSNVLPDQLDETYKTASYSISYPKGFSVESCAVTQLFGSSIAIIIDESKFENSIAYDIKSITPLLNGMDKRFQDEGYNVDWGKVQTDSELEAYWIKQSKGEMFIFKYIVPADKGYYELKSTVEDAEQLEAVEMIMNSFRLVSDSWVDPTLTKNYELSNTPGEGVEKFTALEDTYLKDEFKTFLLPKGFSMYTGRFHTFGIVPPDSSFFMMVSKYIYKLATYEDHMKVIEKYLKRNDAYKDRYQKVIGTTAYDIIESTKTSVPGFENGGIKFVDIPTYYLNIKLTNQSFISFHPIKQYDFDNPDFMLVLENMKFHE